MNILSIARTESGSGCPVYGQHELDKKINWFIIYCQLREEGKLLFELS
jgi:hypothetical protein